MANKLDPMDLKQIITLHLDGLSNRKISYLLGISRNTINTYMQLFEASEWSLEELHQLDNITLQARFPSRTTIDNSRFDTLMQFFEKVNLARNHPGFTFQYHYQQYVQESSNPYSYTQFMEHYNRKHAKTRGSMKLEHDPGHEVFIDFAGKKLHITDKHTGEQIPVEVFVAILPNSQYTYVEACMSQKREDLILCMGHTFSFYGGVPRAIVSDNLKSAVSRSNKYEPEINRTFKEFALHYGCVVNPARRYAPQDKALVENAVHLVYQRIYYPLREMTFFSLADLNKEIRRLLETYNDLLFQRKESSRRELFQSVERQYLKPLPGTPYQLKDYRRAKVQQMGYVYFSPDKNYYSVPYRYIGKQTQIHYSKSMVEVYYNNVRIAIHERTGSTGTYITIRDHLSSTHQEYAGWSPEYFKNLARKHGAFVLAFITGLLDQSEYPEVSYKRAMGVIQLHKSYSSIRLNDACERALYGSTYNYSMVRNILQNNLDRHHINTEELDQSISHIPAHENIRGASAYQ
jgi:transposase